MFEKVSELPYGAEWSRAPLKKFQETILFVPFYGAHKLALRRHAEFVNQLGYDCLLFDLKDSPMKMMQFPFSAHGDFGLKHVWADQVERLLGEMPGQKIIYSFSNPSMSAFEAVARRWAADIKGMVCDGGPSGNLWASMVNFYKYEKPLRTFPLRAAAATVAALLWEPNFVSTLDKDLKLLPKGFRILSIRGWKDRLITPQMIDAAFEAHPQLDWQKLSIPQAGHLNGLKDFASEYTPAVEQFLQQISTSV